MSVPNDNSRIQYTGNNSTVVAYSVPFVFFQNEDLRVTVTDAAGIDTPLALGSGFSATGAGNENGGSVLTVAAWDSTHRVTIYREVDATQEVVYVENDAFPAKTNERALDKLTMLAQQIQRSILQGLRFRTSDGERDPIPAVASSLIGLDALKNPRAMTAAEVGVWLNLSQQYFGQGSVTFLNEADREATAPQYLGQIGIQLDTLAIYAAHSLTVGDWGAPDVGIGTGSITTSLLANAVLSADVAGRAKMADSFVTLPKLLDGLFTADDAGREKFAAGFVSAAMLAAGAVEANLPAGTILQTVISTFSDLALINVAIPADNSVPQSNEGTQVLSATITPKSSANKILIFAVFNGSTTGSQIFAMALFRDSETSAFRAAGTFGAGYGHQIPIHHLDSPATTAPITYKMRAGANGAVGLYVNGSSSTARLYGGAGQCSLVLMEVKG